MSEILGEIPSEILVTTVHVDCNVLQLQKQKGM